MAPPSVTIRPYVASDWPAICRIYDAAKPVELEAGGVAASFWPLDDDPDRKKDFELSTVQVAEADDGLVGFVGVRGAYIGWLFVDPRWFRRGVGRTLLACALDAIRGEAWLWVFEGNAAAIALYTRAGFAITERRASQNRGFPSRGVKMCRRPTG